LNTLIPLLHDINVYATTRMVSPSDHSLVLIEFGLNPPKIHDLFVQVYLSVFLSYQAVVGIPKNSALRLILD